MVKVCHMTSGHNPEDMRIFRKQCASLAKAGYEVCLVTRGGSYEKNGVRIAGVGAPPKGRMERMTKFAKRIYRAALALDADIYQFHDPELLPYGLKLKKKGKTVVFDSHEDVPGTIKKREWIPDLLRGTILRAYTGFERSVCRRLDAVIAATPHVAERFLAMNPRSVLVTNYPILTKEAAVPDFRSKTLVFAGGIAGQWNHHHIIKALEKLPECRYLLCGSVKDAYLRELQSLPGWKQVDYRGVVPGGEVPGLLAGSYAGLALLSYIPNSDGKRGNMSNTKIFEEMMAGLPVVCTDFVLWKEFVDRWHCGVCVEPENPDAIAAAVRYLLDHPEEARRMGENGRRAVEEEFNWSTEERKLLDLYAELSKSVGK